MQDRRCLCSVPQRRLQRNHRCSGHWEVQVNLSLLLEHSLAPVVKPLSRQDQDQEDSLAQLLYSHQRAGRCSAYSRSHSSSSSSSSSSNSSSSRYPPASSEAQCSLQYRAVEEDFLAALLDSSHRLLGAYSETQLSNLRQVYLGLPAHSSRAHKPVSQSGRSSPFVGHID